MHGCFISFGTGRSESWLVNTARKQKQAVNDQAAITPSGKRRETLPWVLPEVSVGVSPPSERRWGSLGACWARTAFLPGPPPRTEPCPAANPSFCRVRRELLCCCQHPAGLLGGREGDTGGRDPSASDSTQGCLTAPLQRSLP